MQRLAIIGQAPNSNGLGEKGHLMGKFGERLAVLLGISFENYEHNIWRYNLVNYYPGKVGKGDVFPLSEAQESAKIVLESMESMENMEVLLLGKNVAKAFGFKKVNFLESFSVGTSTYHIVPHPSGINMWWNSPENRKKAENYFQKVIEKITF